MTKQTEALVEQTDSPISEGWQITVAHGHSGYGVYAHMEEYPEEGAMLLIPIEQPAQQLNQFRVRYQVWVDAANGDARCLMPGDQVWIHDPKMIALRVVGEVS